MAKSHSRKRNKKLSSKKQKTAELQKRMKYLFLQSSHAINGGKRVKYKTSSVRYIVKKKNGTCNFN